MGKLANPRHESFCQAYDALSMTDATPLEIGQRAYVMAGNTPNRANHNKVLARAEVKARLAELKREREARALAARMPAEHLLTSLGELGIVRIGDFFELDASRLLQPRDLKTIPAELAVALMKFMRDAMGVRAGLL